MKKYKFSELRMQQLPNGTTKETWRYSGLVKEENVENAIATSKHLGALGYRLVDKETGETKEVRF